ncbi:MAG: LPS export ABC transporter periplasmic protein LptC [Acidobacteriia bacterium]|nr:LPS export ABC transporter periplasmic protein LptC [Terriglobia bacterium]
MRGTRWLLLLAILAIVAGIGITYRTQRQVLQKQAPAKPPMLPTEVSGLRDDFEHEHTEAGQKKWNIAAHTVRQEKDSSQVQLQQVRLKIYSKTSDDYDLVTSAKAEFDQTASRMYSEGDVEITLRVPVVGQPTRPLVNIKSSGVTFDVKASKASTDRAASFTFENGTGHALGAFYDATTRELHLRHDAEIDMKPPGPHAKPMKIQAGEVTYKESESRVWLNEWARLTRDNTLVNAASAIVQLEDGFLKQIDAFQAQGTDEYPKRKLEYAADELRVTYNDQGEVDHISGKTNARLVSTSEGSGTTMTSDFVDLTFETVNNESVLKKAVGVGRARIESKPVAAPDGKLPETRVVESELIEVGMRPGGREIDTVATLAPGRLDFIPNQPVQKARHLDAQRMIMTYGPANQIQSFRATGIQTETEPNAEERAKKQAVSKTRSKEMSAEFDAKGQMKHMEQQGDFSYQEGDRHAQAIKATMDADSNVMTLEDAARMWDATGATAADRIRIDQKSGDFTAVGHVSSSRQPDKKNSPSGMLSGDQPVEALAGRMTSANHNRLLQYQERVVMWQGGDRITADRVEIDREKRTFRAGGNVITQLLEKKSATEPKAPAGAANATTLPNSQPTPTFVVVKAASLVYTDQDRLANYTGGVVLNRPELQVKADELRAVLAESKSDDKKNADDQDQSRLEKAFGDGHVEIVQTALDRTRTGTSDHAEYYTDDERIILRGGQPQMVDSKKGYARGAELTYYVNDDRLLVSGGGPKERATGHLRRKQ